MVQLLLLKAFQGSSGPKPSSLGENLACSGMSVNLKEFRKPPPRFRGLLEREGRRKGKFLAGTTAVCSRERLLIRNPVLVILNPPRCGGR